MEEVFALLGKLIVAAGGGAVVAIAIFRLLATKWLDEKFQRRLEAFRHEQSKELVELRHRIDKEFDRLSKVHGKEIEVLPELWRRLSEAVLSASYLASPMRTYTDPNRLSPDQFEYFLSTTPLTDWEKKEIREADNKAAYFQKRMARHEQADANGTYREFREFFTGNRIFISAEIKLKVELLDDLLWAVIHEAEDGREYRDAKLRSSAREKANKASNVRAEIEALVMSRLRVEGTPMPA